MFYRPRQICFAARDVTQLLPRNFIQSESVFMQLASSNLIYCNKGFNVGGKTRNISFSNRFAAMLHVFAVRFTAALNP